MNTDTTLPTMPSQKFIIESMARHRILGQRSWLEVQSVRDVLGYSIPMIGMYAFGEISPFGSLENTQNTYMHNETILIVAVS